MKKTISLKPFAIIQIVFCVIYAIAGAASLYGTIMAASEGILNLLSLCTAIIINVAWIWLLVTAILLLRKTPRSYPALFANSFVSTLALISVLIVTIKSYSGNTAGDIALVVLYAVIPVFSWITFFRMHTIIAENKKKPTASFLDARLTLTFALTAFISIVFIFITSRISILTPIAIHEVTASSQINTSSALRVADGYDSTWWTPSKPKNTKISGKATTQSGGSGINEWVKLELRNPAVISGISILGGAHFTKYPKDGSTYPLNSRPKKILVELSNGKVQQLEMKDSDEPQIFSLPESTAHWVKVTIQSTFKGDKWDELCISEIKVLKTKKLFSN